LSIYGLFDLIFCGADYWPLWLRCHLHALPVPLVVVVAVVVVVV
jgi:hypothetical protein